MTVAIVEYNAGNIYSVVNALKRLGIEPVLTHDAETLMRADRVLFPGQGEARTTMESLKSRRLDEVIRELKQPVLGICVGQQLMCKHSEEGDVDCIGIFDLPVKRFRPTRHEDKVPAMGWNTLHDLKTPLFNGLRDNEDYAYFVHSYYVPLSKEYTIATANYIHPYSAALHKDNFYATQFHPEKSGSVGEQILRNFIDGLDPTIPSLGGSRRGSSITLIPAIDILDGKCVRLTKGDYTQKKVYNENPAEVAREFERLGFKRLHVVDLDGAKAKHIVNIEALKAITTATSLTIDFGGGIKSEEDLEKAFAAGAQMVTLGSIAVTDREFTCRAIERFGAERIILGADVRNGKISINGWKEDSQEDLLPFLKYYVDKGVRNVLCTEISKDGMLCGPAIELYKEIMQHFPTLNLIASGGVSCNSDIKALKDAGIPAVVFGKAFYEGRINLKDLRGSVPLPSSCGLAKRIIPCLDVKDSMTVKGTNFVNLRNAGDPVELAKIYSQQGADELVFLDITASHEGRKTFTEMVTRVAQEINIPFTVGGGINALEDVERLLYAGADKVSINSAALRRPELIDEITRKFGSQVLVVAIDAKQEENPVIKRPGTGSWRCYLNGGRIPTDRELFSWAKEVTDRGAGEILFTSMNHDGTKNGYANTALHALHSTLPIPIIASGGAGRKEHFFDVFEKGKADAALAASVFHFGEIPIPELKEYLNEKGIKVRL